MGNQNSSNSTRVSSGNITTLRSSDWPLQFHTTHGDNVELSADKSRARRADSFCKGICFSNRPIAINEKVYVRFYESSTSWSGVLRFGFSSVDPATIRGSDLPRYACPDLTNKSGNWAKALGERYAKQNNILHFYVTRSGDVLYGVNGEDKGLFFSGVNTSGPLWTLMDIYGNTMCIEFVESDSIVTNTVNSAPTTPTVLVSQRPEFSTSLSSLSINNQANQELCSLPVLRFHANADFKPVFLHSLCGKNVRISGDKTIAVRLREEYCNGYVFTSSPLQCGEKLVIQVLGIDRTYVGGLAFGFTSYDPTNLQQNDLPDDSDMLLDRPEYWVVNKDVCRNPEIGDELSFFLTEEGEVRYSRNNHKIATLMHIDRTLPLWAFFDVYGNVQKIKVLGTIKPLSARMSRPQSAPYRGLKVALPPDLNLSPRSAPALDDSPTHQQSYQRSMSVPASALAQQTQPNSPPPVLPRQPASPTSSPQPITEQEELNECTVCYERIINAVLYTCGHMCMCFECAMFVKREKGGLCPICRQPIQDVIKTYRT